MLGWGTAGHRRCFKHLVLRWVQRPSVWSWSGHHASRVLNVIFHFFLSDVEVREVLVSPV